MALWKLLSFLATLTLENGLIAYGLLWVTTYVPKFQDAHNYVCFVCFPLMLAISGIIAWVNIEAHFQEGSQQ